ncbi:MAG TPA: hypothetical protein VNQ77_07585 [Frankiaceae bacterium]|nr:hypothetical protein [Frankiaceae bacterium]
MTIIAGTADTAGDELWYDEILERGDGWATVLVTTTDGRKIKYRLSTRLPDIFVDQDG